MRVSWKVSVTCVSSVFAVPLYSVLAFWVSIRFSNHIGNGAVRNMYNFNGFVFDIVAKQAPLMQNGHNPRNMRPP